MREKRVLEWYLLEKPPRVTTGLPVLPPRLKTMPLMLKTPFRIVLMILMLSLTHRAFALGKAAKPIEPQNPEWTLCITQFDVTALPPAQAAVGGVIARQIVEHFNGLEFKQRPVAEYDYYWNVAWRRGQSDVAKQITTKQTERDKLVFTGEPNWKIRSQQKKLDADIAVLKQKLEDAALSSPAIAREPRVTVTSDNRAGNFPASPKAGGEYYFCVQQKADAMLIGFVSEYHERILVELKLWTAAARAVIYEDQALFSIEDSGLALDEFSSRFINVISGMSPALLVVRAEPSNAVIIIDDHHAGRGVSEEVDRTPGPVEVTVYAENHVTATEKIELREGERTEADFTLKPVPLGEVAVAAKDENARVYSGALYTGDAPVKLSGPLDSYKQINLETGDGRAAQTLFRITAPDAALTLKPKTPPAAGRTEKARKSFYGALGRLWIIGPLAFLSAGYSNVEVNAFNISPYNRTDEQFKNQETVYYISMGFMIATCVAALDVLVRLGIYIYQGTREGVVFTPKEFKMKNQSAEAPAGASGAPPPEAQGEGNVPVER